MTLTVLAVGAACTSGTDVSPSSDTTRDRSLPTIATVPPTSVDHTTPTTLRPLAVDRAVLDGLYPLSPTEMLSVGQTAEPDGRQTARFWVIDVVTGITTELSGPPVHTRNYTGSDTFTQDGDTYYYGAATCTDPPGGCAAPPVEVWRLEATTRTWDRVGRYPPAELVGQPWDGRDIQVGPIAVQAGRVHLSVSDDGDYAENRGSHDIVIDPDTGDFERETPKRLVYPDHRGCRASSGSNRASSTKSVSYRSDARQRMTGRRYPTVLQHRTSPVVRRRCGRSPTSAGSTSTPTATSSHRRSYRVVETRRATSTSPTPSTPSLVAAPIMSGSWGNRVAISSLI